MNKEYVVYAWSDFLKRYAEYGRSASINKAERLVKQCRDEGHGNYYIMEVEMPESEAKYRVEVRSMDDSSWIQYKNCFSKAEAKKEVSRARKDGYLDVRIMLPSGEVLDLEEKGKAAMKDPEPQPVNEFELYGEDIRRLLLEYGYNGALTILNTRRHGGEHDSAYVENDTNEAVGMAELRIKVQSVYDYLLNS